MSLNANVDSSRCDLNTHSNTGVGGYTKYNVNVCIKKEGYVIILEAKAHLTNSRGSSNKMSQ